MPRRLTAEEIARREGMEGPAADPELCAEMLDTEPGSGIALAVVLFAAVFVAGLAAGLALGAWAG